MRYLFQDALSMLFARRVIELMLLRRGPQDLPGNANMLVASALGYCILSALQIGLVAPAGRALFQSMLATALLALYAHSVLRIRSLSNRFTQTATALFASGALLTLIMLAPTHIMAPYLQAVGQASDPENVPMPPTLIMFVYVVMGIWGLAIYTHIYRNALDVGLWLGLATSMAFEILLLFVFSVLG